MCMIQTVIIVLVPYSADAITENWKIKAGYLFLRMDINTIFNKSIFYFMKHGEYSVLLFIVH